MGRAETRSSRVLAKPIIPPASAMMGFGKARKERTRFYLYPSYEIRSLFHLRVIHQLEQPRRRHRQRLRADADGVADRIGDGRHGRHDGNFADPAQSVRMPGVGDFHDLGADHRNIRSDRHAVVEETRVLQPPVGAIEVFLVERPADALYGAALELTLDLQRMDRLAGVLDDGVALDVDAAGFAVDLDVDDVEAEARAGTRHAHFGVPRNGAVACHGLGRDLRNRQGLESADVRTCRPAVAVFERHAFFGHAPDAGGALAQFGYRLARRI